MYLHSNKWVLTLLFHCSALVRCSWMKLKCPKTCDKCRHFDPPEDTVDPANVDSRASKEISKDSRAVSDEAEVEDSDCFDVDAKCQERQIMGQCQDFKRLERFHACSFWLVADNVILIVYSSMAEKCRKTCGFCVSKTGKAAVTPPCKNVVPDWDCEARRKVGQCETEPS